LIFLTKDFFDYLSFFPGFFSWNQAQRPDFSASFFQDALFYSFFFRAGNAASGNVEGCSLKSSGF
jgi:hypothetical protein